MDYNYNINIEKKEDRFALIPPSEMGLKTIEADYFFQAASKPFLHLEGLCFDRKDNLYYTSARENGSFFRINMKTMEKHQVFSDPELRPVAVKIHRDGRLFVCCLGGLTKNGCILVMNPDGSNVTSVADGYNIDDLVFDADGGFYFTDFIGSVSNPTGGVYYVTPDLKTITCFAGNLARPNGVALSMDGKTLWITEFSAGRLLRFPVGQDAGFPSVPYHFTGYAGPDSCSVDEEDNLYVAMCNEGRVMVFNPMGYPIGQVLIPGREKGYNLFSTHPAVRPGTRELYIACCDDVGDNGAWIFRSESFGIGNRKSYQFI